MGDYTKNLPECENFNDSSEVVPYLFFNFQDFEIQSCLFQFQVA